VKEIKQALNKCILGPFVVVAVVVVAGGRGSLS